MKRTRPSIALLVACAPVPVALGRQEAADPEGRLQVRLEGHQFLRRYLDAIDPGFG